jgi:glycerol-3-phosphate acyltransferase PlsY
MQPNHHMALFVATAACAYLLGSINFSVAAARILGAGDLRAMGSGNAGVTNLARAAGRPAASVVLALDLGRAFAVIHGASLMGLGDMAPAMALPMLAGNIFPVFHRFRGGKGVAASVGIILAISWQSMFCGGGVFLLVFALTRRVSPASILMCLGYPGWMLIWGGSATEMAVAGTIALLVPITHRKNISRLIAGTEPRTGEHTPPSEGGDR